MVDDRVELFKNKEECQEFAPFLWKSLQDVLDYDYWEYMSNQIHDPKTAHKCSGRCGDCARHGQIGSHFQYFTGVWLPLEFGQQNPTYPTALSIRSSSYSRTRVRMTRGYLNGRIGREHMKHLRLEVLENTDTDYTVINQDNGSFVLQERTLEFCGGNPWTEEVVDFLRAILMEKMALDSAGSL